jgi:hypothetical protein
MAGKRNVHTPVFKFRVAPDVPKGETSVNEPTGQFEAHPTLIHGWQPQLRAGTGGDRRSPRASVRLS